MEVLSRLQFVKTFAFDMDGVLTDGSIMVNNENDWLRKMNIRDGYALQLAVKSGYRVVVISGSNSAYVKARLKALGVDDVFMSVKNKSEFLKKYVEDKKVAMNELLYMGDDIPDYSCMEMAGIAACPADAASEIKEVSSYISPYPGGSGCVRDVIEKVLKLNNKWTLQNNITSS